MVRLDDVFDLNEFALPFFRQADQAAAAVARIIEPDDQTFGFQAVQDLGDPASGHTQFLSDAAYGEEFFVIEQAETFQLGLKQAQVAGIFPHPLMATMDNAGDQLAQPVRLVFQL